LLSGGFDHLANRLEQVSRPGAWEAGQSGNPKGRPRHSIRAHLRRIAAKKRPDGETNAAAVARTAYELALAGSLGAIVYLTDQLDGKPAGTIEVTGSDGGPIRFAIVPPPGVDVRALPASGDHAALTNGSRE
jgi:hypothetical protein